MLGLALFLAATFVGCHANKISVDVNVGLGIPTAMSPGSNSRSRIVGGDPVKPHTMPWQAAVVWEKNETIWCGGTIICPKFVMSAANCNYDNHNKLIDVKKQFKVLIGEHDLAIPSGERHRIKAVHQHPKFDLGDRDYDFSFHELRRPIKFGPKAKALYLASGKGRPLPEGTMMVVSGWGATKTGQTSHLLRAIKIPKISEKTCKKAITEVPITERMICAGDWKEGGKDACTGDIGGPLAWLDPRHGRIMLHGVVSFGDGGPCARPKHPGVYAKIEAVLGWIKKETRNGNKKTCSRGNCMTWQNLDKKTREKYFKEK